MEQRCNLALSAEPHLHSTLSTTPDNIANERRARDCSTARSSEWSSRVAPRVASALSCVSRLKLVQVLPISARVNERLRRGRGCAAAASAAAANVQ